jgi:hypothetical protein
VLLADGWGEELVLRSLRRQIDEFEDSGARGGAGRRGDDPRR